MIPACLFKLMELESFNIKEDMPRLLITLKLISQFKISLLLHGIECLI